MNTGDTAWVLMSSALVMLMTAPGLALFYGGLVRKKNILSILMQCLVIMAVMSLQWVLYGYSLAFHPGEGFTGGLGWAGLVGVGMEPFADYAATIPHLAFMIFQAMFAVITPALIIGAFAERMKFSAFLLFTVLWATIVYDPVCHWVWGIGGWIRALGALDFAGGTVVHVASGIAALAAALVLGKRKNVEKGIPPHNLVFVVTGAALLWFGWFGFNAGSALGANGLAANAFVVTHIAASAAAVMYMLLEWFFSGKPTVLGTATGAVAGLVAITPAAGFVGIVPSMLMGAIVSFVCYFFVVVVKKFFGYDDALDAFGVHGVGGTVGALLTGVFASKAINPAGFDGLLAGNANQVIVQLIATGATMAYSFIVSLVLLKLIDWTIGLRVNDKVENVGLDLSEHHETAYTLLQ